MSRLHMAVLNVTTMNAWTRTALVASACLLAGCATSHMDTVPDAERAVNPPAGASLVYFIRPAVAVGAERSYLFDSDQYVGTLEQDRHIAYVTKPGRHIFMVVSEAADFMTAELAADKVYYATLQGHLGIVKERVSFVPAGSEPAIKDAQKLVRHTGEVRPNARGRGWAAERRARFETIGDKWFPRWEAGGSREALQASSGR